MATARLRKSFKYPDDDDSDFEELDEEHQEALITRLKTEDQAKNDIYRKVFTMIPALMAIFFLYTIVIATTPKQRLIALLSTSSLVCTGYILYFMPIQSQEKKGKRPVYQIEAEKGPVERYLLYLNAGLAGLLLVAAFLSWRRSDGEAALREALPAIVFGTSMFARQQLAPLDMEELQKARYEYKGA